MNYLVTTDRGNLYSIYNSNKLKLLEYTKKSIFTNDSSLRFIKKYGDDYLIGASDELLLYRTKYKPEILAHIALPGLVDIKDIVIDDNFIAILSGLRDSIYILTADLKNIVVCFNINKDGKIELFKNRQMQCREIPSNYFQVFYCPGMNNFHRFEQMIINGSDLRIISDGCCVGRNSFVINLNNFSCKQEEFLLDYPRDLEIPYIGMESYGEGITDYLKL